MDNNLTVVLNDSKCDLGQNSNVKVKDVKSLKSLNEKINWKEVFQIRNELNAVFFNESNVKNIENELVINFES